jgi:hypothetical protein
MKPLKNKADTKCFYLALKTGLFVHSSYNKQAMITLKLCKTIYIFKFVFLFLSNKKTRNTRDMVEKCFKMLSGKDLWTASSVVFLQFAVFRAQ